MGRVYLGRARGPEGFVKQVAIKTVHPHLIGTPPYLAMFLDEARLMARLTHPNLCHAIDAGWSEDGCYVAMEYLPGATLNQIERAAHDAGPDPRLPAYLSALAAQAAEHERCRR